MTRRYRSKSQLLYVAWGGLLVVIIVIGLCLAANKNSQKEVTDNSEQVKIVTDEEQEEMDEKINEEENNEDEKTVKEEIVQYDGEDPNIDTDLSGVITYAEVVAEELKIRVNIDQYLESGVCTLGIKQNGVIIYRATANIASAASTATCEGFDVPVEDLGYGAMQIEINVDAGGKAGVIAGEVTL